MGLRRRTGGRRKFRLRFAATLGAAVSETSSNAKIYKVITDLPPSLCGIKLSNLVTFAKTDSLKQTLKLTRR